MLSLCVLTCYRANEWTPPDPLSEGEGTNKTNGTMRAIRIIILVAVMLLAGCQDRKADEARHEEAGSEEGYRPFDEGEAYEWEMKRELKEEDSVRLMKMIRRLMDEGPMYY